MVVSPFAGRFLKGGFHFAVSRSKVTGEQEQGTRRVLQSDGLIGLLNSRSFGAVWYWLIVIGMWSFSGRRIVGVPVEVFLRARRALSKGDAEGADVMTLLDWLSLSLPHWRMGQREGVITMGVTAFLLTSLAFLGFAYDLEMAQALTLILLPMQILFWMRVHLARRLAPLLASGQAGEIPITDLATAVIRRVVWHRRFVTLLAIVAVAVTAFWAAIWSLTHPNGL